MVAMDTLNDGVIRRQHRILRGLQNSAGGFAAQVVKVIDTFSVFRSQVCKASFTEVVEIEGSFQGGDRRFF